MKKLLFFMALLVVQQHLMPQKFRRNVTSKQSGNIVCITIPKTGSHMLIKCLCAFNIPGVYLDYTKWQKKSPTKHSFVDPLPRYFISRMQRAVNKNKRLFWYGHQPHTTEFASYLKNNTYKCFFLIRDPRDQVVSAVKFSKENKAFAHMPFNEHFLHALFGQKTADYVRPKEIRPVLNLLFLEGVVDFYRLFLPWITAEKFLTVRFENLVGEKGGGSRAAQLEEINKIATHLELKLSSEKIAELADSLFGGTLTFREGQIGSWKKYFTPEIKEMFKKTPGANQLLIDLGYEQDENW